ncbi:helix-hairpin-helix domain-containing protein [Kribbella sp. CA-247076]|uniref:helix-hairpin-helix domain-containing protein n=1 Tax=Kribbella sp. CA-247076 TaxID=3239941 RepID=UPI003D8F839F
MHPQPRVRARTDWKAVILKLAGAAVPILTLGAASSVLMGVVAVRRRSLLLAASAAVYLGITIAFWSVDWGNDLEADSAKGDAFMLAQLLAIPVASVQAAVVIASQRRKARVALNEASADTLAALPGLNAQIAATIVASRQTDGRFRHVGELWSRGLLQGLPDKELVDRLLVISVQDRKLS